MKYTVFFEPQEEGGYTVFVPTLPGCISQGETFEEAKTNIKEAIELYLEDVKPDDLDFLYTEAERILVPVEIVLAK